MPRRVPTNLFMRIDFFTCSQGEWSEDSSDCYCPYSDRLSKRTRSARILRFALKNLRFFIFQNHSPRQS